MGDMQTTTNIQDTIDRYLVMWNEPDPQQRSEQARAIWTGDGCLIDPLIEAVGPGHDRGGHRDVA